jgi:hypothetical protein
MRFFNTKIEGGPYGGHYFVTSEVGPDGKRAYSVREAADDGGVSTVGDFQSYSTKGAAVTAAKAMGRGGSRNDEDGDEDDEAASGSRAKTSIRNHRVVGRLSGANGDFRVYETHRTFGPDPIYYVGQIVGGGVDMHPYGHDTKAEAMASARRKAGKA